MKLEEFNGEMEKLRKISNTPETLEILANLERDYQTMDTEHRQAIADRDKAIEEKKQYAELNTQLWLASHSTKDTSIGNAETGDQGHEENEPKKRSYEDLFKEDDK